MRQQAARLVAFPADAAFAEPRIYATLNRRSMSAQQAVFASLAVVTLASAGLVCRPAPAAQAGTSTICDRQQLAAVDGKAPEEKILACDDFLNGQPGRWTASHGVSPEDIADGKLLLANRHEDQRPGAEQTTQVVYILGEQSGGITIEVKFDDFAPAPNSRFIVELQAAPGNALDIGRWSARGEQYVNGTASSGPSGWVFRIEQ